MRRKFEFLVLDKENQLVSTYPLVRVTQLTGIGFSQNVTVLESDTVDYIIKQAIEKKDIKLQVHFLEPDSYAKAEGFQNWLAAYINLANYKTVFQFESGQRTRRVDVYVKDYSVLGREANVTSIQLTIKPISPNYESLSQLVLITEGLTFKAYPYMYPYSYGGGSFSGNTINNRYIASIPLMVIFRGAIANPECTLEDEKGNPYATIRFNGLTLNAGERLVVDGINQRIVFYEDDDAEGTDYFNQIDKTADTFLIAKPGISRVLPNLDAGEVTKPSVTINYVQYII